MIFENIENFVKNIFVNHVFGLVFDDLRVWEYQNRILHVVLPQGQFCGGPGRVGWGRWGELDRGGGGDI